MPKEGLEPTLLTETDPKSVVSANFTIRANGGNRNRTSINAVQVHRFTIKLYPQKCEPFTRDGSGLILTFPRGFPRKRMSAPFIKLTQNGTR